MRDRRVLPAEVRRRALLDRERQRAHRLVARREREQALARHHAVGDRAQRAHERDEDPAVGQEVGQGNPSGIRSRARRDSRAGGRTKRKRQPVGAAARSECTAAGRRPAACSSPAWPTGQGSRGALSAGPGPGPPRRAAARGRPGRRAAAAARRRAARPPGRAAAGRRWPARRPSAAARASRGSGPAARRGAARRPAAARALPRSPGGAARGPAAAAPARRGAHAGLAGTEVQQADDGLQQHVVDRDAVHLGLERPHLLLGELGAAGRIGGSLGHGTVSSSATGEEGRLGGVHALGVDLGGRRAGVDQPALALGAVELGSVTSAPVQARRRSSDLAGRELLDARRLEVEQPPVEPVADRPPHVLLDQAAGQVGRGRSGVDLARGLGDAGDDQRRRARRTPRRWSGCRRCAPRRCRSCGAAGRTTTAG